MQPAIAIMKPDVSVAGARAGQTAATETALTGLMQALQGRGYHFTTITPASHARVNARPANAIARTMQDVFGWSRVFHPAIMPPDIFALMQAGEILEPSGVQHAPWRSLVRVSSLGQGLFMHSAFPTLAPDSVFFGPDTYKFVDAIKAFLAGQTEPIVRAADICCGAGPGALAIALARPSAEVLMIDINEAALRLASVNAACVRAFGARAVNSDLLTGAPGQFDLIVAHPPYLVDRGTRVYRHGGGALGAGLSLAIVHAALERLSPGGTLLLFTGIAMIGGEDPFRREISAIMADENASWSYREVDPDVFGEELDHPPYDEADRIALIVLEIARPA